ncbi:MAG TPA: hypothetical protein VF719_01580, partial [Abditibacteriaceae bacterium]
AQHPKSYAIASIFAQMACYGADKPTAKMLMNEKLHNRLDLEVWRTKEWFITCRDWANSA